MKICLPLFLLFVAPAPAAEMREVVLGPDYRAGGLHQFLFGHDYRALWTTPVKLPVLDLGSFAGGLTPVRRVGGQQTKGLALRGADGRSYTFRGVDKDPSSILPPDLQGTIADRIVQDQIAAAHPAGPVVAAPLSEAAGVLHVTPQLVVMPDDPRLGEFRSVFAGLPGFIEEFPQPAAQGQPGFQGAVEILNGEDMLKRLRASAETRVDEKAFLRARLFDVYLGDWDRHLKQWRWLRLPDAPVFQPFPEDRDQAFSRFEGVMLTLARPRLLRFVNFGSEYPSMVGLTYNGWDQDRRLLAGLEWPVWQETAADLVRRLSDATIDGAVAQLPEEFRANDGARLARDLKRRRDGLPEAARRFYRHLSGKVTVPGTDAAEWVEARATEGGDLEVRVSSREGEEPFFRRTFRRGETEEVTLDLRGGDDHVSVSGRPRVKLRVAGGPGNDALSAAGDGERPKDADRASYVPPPGNPKAPWIPPRDWGRQNFFTPWINAGPDIGAFFGLTVLTQGYGFRKHPYGDRQSIGLGYATKPKAFRFVYDGRFPRESSRSSWSLEARASGIEILRFYGFGNETRSDFPDDFFKVEQDQIALRPSYTWGLGRGWELSLGPTLKHARTTLDRNRLIGFKTPYGASDGFGQAGLHSELRLDSRDVPAAAQHGALFTAGGSYYPALWDVDKSFGDVHGEAATYLSAARAPLQPTLALRAAGKRVFGLYPFHEAAFLGGGGSLRGFRAQRFAGDASLYGSAELRLFLTRFYLLFPGELGAFGLADGGRVYLENETSDRWHTSVGGGLWFAFLNRANTITVTVARSRERTALYVHGGFVF
jgi:hypothetical protein